MRYMIEVIADKTAGELLSLKECGIEMGDRLYAEPCTHTEGVVWVQAQRDTTFIKKGDTVSLQPGEYKVIGVQA